MVESIKDTWGKKNRIDRIDDWRWIGILLMKGWLIPKCCWKRGNLIPICCSNYAGNEMILF
jgi:hypothetical protein